MGHSRHADHHEVQPIPCISKECEGSEAETPGQDFDHGLKGVDASENVPGEVGQVQDSVGHRLQCVQMAWTYSTVLLHAGGLLIVMNTQLDRMVTMMNMLNNLIQH